MGVEGLLLACVQLRVESEDPRSCHCLDVLLASLFVEPSYGVLSIVELLEVHRLHLVLVSACVRLLEGVVLERDDDLLLVEVNLLELQSGVTILLVICLFVVGSVVELEGEEGLVLGHLHHGRVCDRETCVAFVLGVVVYHHTAHHVCLFVAFIDPQNISFDTVIEGSGRYLYLFLCLTDVFPELVDLVVCYRNKVVGNEECRYAYHHA